MLTKTNAIQRQQQAEREAEQRANLRAVDRAKKEKAVTRAFGYR